MRSYLISVWKIAFALVLFIVQPMDALAQALSKAGRIKYSAREWVEKNFSKGNVPPFSFVYGGVPSGRLIPSWKYDAVKETHDGKTERYTFTYSDRRSGLTAVCEVKVYTDFNAVEWVLRFLNKGNSNSSLLEKVEVINRSFGFDEPGEFILHHANGSNARPTDFAPLEKRLEPGEVFRMTPAGARGSSDHTAFPFFNMECKGNGGIMAAVGWTGKWYAEVWQANRNRIALRAGMETMQLNLFPGEAIRTPSICLLFWEGQDRMHGHNRFRQFVLAHHSPKINGKVVETPLAAGISRGGPAPCNEFTCLTESYAIATVQRFQQFDMVPEVCWIDAGWYEGDVEWWQGVGNWTVDSKRFPDGLKPVADAVHKAGAKLLVWFELERVRKGTRLANEHPGWLLDYSGTYNKDDLYNYGTYLFDLGNKEARLWLTDFVTDFLRKEGIDYYRQDFNWVNAKECWELKDKPGRVGISEIRYVEGLYAFWDSLHARIPGILIDNCASGGRRIDLETISRSVPLWRSDYGYGEPDGYQNHTYGLNFYLPLHGTGAFSGKPYDFRSSLASSVVLFWDIHSAQSSVPQMQKCMNEFRQMRPFYYGDYYPLVSPENIDSDTIWFAYQLNRPLEGDGKIIAFRRKASSLNVLTVRLKGIDINSTYQIINEDSKVVITKKGIELVKGFVLNLDKPLSSQLLTYKKVQLVDN